MLQSLRDNTKGLVAGILIGLLVIIFALSGAEALFSGDTTSRAVVTVNGEDITERDIARQVELQRRQILNRYGDSVPSEFVSDERLRPAAIESLIERTVMVQEAKDKGMAVSEETLNNIIREDEQFQGPEGNFDPNRYEQLLRTVGFTPASYKRVLREEILLTQLRSGIAGSGFVTPAELEQLISLSDQTRSFRYLTLDAEQVSDEIQVSDAEVAEYYNNNQQQFTQPEQVAVDYIDLSVEALMEDIEIAEEDLRAQYQQGLEAMETEGDSRVQRRIAHILIENSNAEEISEVREKIEQGVEFAELARQYSDDLGSSEQGGDLGYVPADSLPEAFAEVVPELEKGEISKPVQTEAGTHFIKLLDERGSELPSFEEQRDQLAQQLKRVEAENQFVELMERLSELSYNAEDLAEVGEELNLPVENTGLFTRQGGEGIAANEKVVESAFSAEVLERGNASDLIELSPSQVIVLKKTDQREAYVRPLDEVRDQIVAELEARRTRELLAQRGEQIESALNDGKTMDQVAEQWDLELKTAEEAVRNDPSHPRELLQHVFSLPKPDSDEPVFSGVHVNGNYTIVALTQVEPGSMGEFDEEQRQALEENIASMLGEQDFAAYRNLLREQAEIVR